MKLWKLHIALIFCFATCTAYGQNSPSRFSEKANDSLYLNPPIHNTQIKTNPLAAIWGAVPFTAEYRLAVEFNIAHNQTSQVSVSYMGKGLFLSALENSINQTLPNGQSIKFVVNGARLQLTHKLYFKNTWESGRAAPYGLYVAPHLSYSTAFFSTRTGNQYDIYIQATQFNVAALAGYQFCLFDHVPFDLFSGIGYKENTLHGKNQGNIVNLTNQLGPSSYTSNLKLYLGFNVGIGFK